MSARQVSFNDSPPPPQTPPRRDSLVYSSTALSKGTNYFSEHWRFFVLTTLGIPTARIQTNEMRNYYEKFLYLKKRIVGPHYRTVDVPVENYDRISWRDGSMLKSPCCAIMRTGLQILACM